MRTNDGDVVSLNGHSLTLVDSKIIVFGGASRTLYNTDTTYWETGKKKSNYAYLHLCNLFLCLLSDEKTRCEDYLVLRYA